MTESEREIHDLWRNQLREEHAMSIDVIRARAARLERKVRGWNLVSAILFPALIVMECWRVWVEPNMLERTGDLLTIAALLYLTYHWWRSAAVEVMPTGLGLTSSVDFYRLQLVRQRDLAANPWRWMALFVPGVSLSLFGKSLERPLSETIAVAAFGVALFLVVAWVIGRMEKRYQAEIEALSD